MFLIINLNLKRGEKRRVMCLELNEVTPGNGTLYYKSKKQGAACGIRTRVLIQPNEVALIYGILFFYKGAKIGVGNGACLRRNRTG